MSKEILIVAETLANQKGLDEDVIFDAIETALASATRKATRKDIDVRVTIDRNTGDTETFRRWTVVEDDYADKFTEESEEEPLSPEKIIPLSEAVQKDPELEVGDIIEQQIDSVPPGRIVAQTFKQVIAQEVRKKERERVIKNYTEKLNQLISGIVKKVDRTGVILDLGENAEALISRDDMIPRETLRTGDRVRGYLYEIRQNVRGPQLLVSRTHPQMLIELFKVEVPEIGEEVIEIKAAARDAGSRSKIAVKTNDGRIDPIGACVGMRGSRVQAISGELAGERIDIILWDDNPASMVINALAPGEVSSIVVDEDKHAMDISVEEEQLAQVIGRNGQNVRLATELTGWRLNVMSTEQYAEKSEGETKKILNVFVDKLGVDEDVAAILVEEGFSSLEEVAYVPVEEMLAIEGFDEDVVNELRERANDRLLTDAIATDEKLAGEKPADDLLTMEGMTEELAYALAGHGIKTMEDLAEQAVDDIVEVEGMDEKLAAQLIMKAREPWFADA